VSAIVLVPKYHRIGEGFSKPEQVAALEHPGRRTNGSQSAASWVGDLKDLKKVILLCSWCRGKFNPRANGYRRFYVPDATGSTDGYASNGKCDACKQMTINTPGGGTAFVSEDTYNLVCTDPVDARRKARMRARSAWISGSARPAKARAKG
jgi:hypothetical protein